MRINSNTTSSITTINMRLFSVDRKMTKHFAPPLIHPDGALYFDNVAFAAIEFEDTYEIDLLIQALERFKQECRGYIGEFR